MIPGMPMHKRDSSSVLTSAVAVVGDGVAVLAGFLAATWLRFSSGWFAVPRGRPDDLSVLYISGAAVASLLFLFIFKGQGLFVRPQVGSFINKIPRIIKAVVMGVVFTAVLAFSLQNEIDFSRGVIALSLGTVSILVLLERYILFRLEWAWARRIKRTNHVLILGTDSVAAHVTRTLSREAMLRSTVIGFLRTDLSEPDAEIPRDRILGTMTELSSILSEHEIDQIILTSTGVEHQRIVDIILLCEQNMIAFNMVPDLFRIMTRSMDVQSLDDIPLLGVSEWPLDKFWDRVVKRIEDILGAIAGLIVSAPIMAVAAVAIKWTSPGPVFFRQERCGEKGVLFRLYKLRTMRADAEQETGPVFAQANDPRATRIGAFLRRHNLDELPQLWNVLKGEMSLVGPRPERPHFVEKFKEDIGRYMWRHVSKPGMTGWAQVNGLRGNTSISERIKYDLYYLENWSLAFDFKILVRTFVARENAY